MLMLSLITDILHGTASLLFPHQCAGCGRIDVIGFCPECRKYLGRLNPPACCSSCGAPLTSVGTGSNTVCQDCRQRKPSYKQVLAAFTYTGPLVNAMVLWKYRNHRELSRTFSRLLIDWVSSECPDWWDSVDLIIPAAQHPKTVRIRGFSPPEVLAKDVAEALVKPYCPRILYKVRETSPQARLNRTEREVNLINSMRVFDRTLVEGKTILVVDDVMTTGATINECARALKSAGAIKVYGLMLARQGTEEI